MPGPGLPAPDPVVKQRPSGPLPPSTRPTYNLAGYPKAAQEGYIDGCETAKQSAYGFKDKNDTRPIRSIEWAGMTGCLFVVAHADHNKLIC